MSWAGTLNPVMRIAPLVLAAVLLGACGITAPRSDEGFADLDSLGVFDTDLRLALSVGPALLHFAARHVDNDPEAEALLRGLDGVRVRIYEVNGDGQRVARRLERMSKDLQADGWDPVALIREEGEQVHMLLKVGEEGIKGMVVMAADSEEEVVLVNLMGKLRPEMFGDVMVALEVDAPEVTLASAN
jgi:hypothetical protein